MSFEIQNSRTKLWNCPPTVSLLKLSHDNLSKAESLREIANADDDTRWSLIIRSRRKNHNNDGDGETKNGGNLDRSKTFTVLKAHNLKSKNFESKVQKAIAERKIFTVIGSGSHYEVLRFLLKSRGWIEKVVDNSAKKVQRKLNKNDSIASMMVQQCPSNFVWLPRAYDGEKFIISCRHALCNRIVRSPTWDFTRKDGLKNCCDNSHWHCIDGISELKSPRTFLLNEYLGRIEFCDEFKFTSATSFLAFLNFSKDFSSHFSESGTISSDLIEFALSYIEMALNENIDENIDSINNFKQRHKSLKLELSFEKHQEQFDLIIKCCDGSKFKWNTKVSIEKLKHRIRRTMATIYCRWPDRIYDGHRNIWILKPCDGSCGKGIELMNNHHKILNHVEKHPECNYIVQKYIGN
jgi:hypothetical protein